MASDKSVVRTQDELVAELQKRFGPDPMDWAFICPSCGDIATVADFKAALAEHPIASRPLASDHIGQICIGRILGAPSRDEKYAGRGCDWAAFGLFRGPEFVKVGDREMPSFRIAPAPEHKEEEA